MLAAIDKVLSADCSTGLLWHPQLVAAEFVGQSLLSYEGLNSVCLYSVSQSCFQLLFDDFLNLLNYFFKLKFLLILM